MSLLSWILNTYPGVELMQHPELNIDLSGFKPLLSDETLNEMQDQYLQVNLLQSLLIININQYTQ